MGVGMPAALWLDEFGSQVWNAFGQPCYLVGSALTHKTYRDVDVRLLLDDGEWEKQGFGDPRRIHSNGKWVSLCLAYSALGKQMTGLNIDFQIQKASDANKVYADTKLFPRSCLGMVSLRMPRCCHSNAGEEE
ncbi:MAG: hypothetical protein WC302_00945 [Candidatus Paceibacterota bacterium]|jgi:hypothetical protein